MKTLKIDILLEVEDELDAHAISETINKYLKEIMDYYIFDVIAHNQIYRSDKLIYNKPTVK